jgi:aldehyde:ferredoxin oxidoreductase
VEFYTGRLLRIDLTTGRSVVEELRMDWADLYVGGKGLLYRYLFAELPEGVDPLSPENPLMVFTGPFAGTTAPTCSRVVVGCKSPATHLVLDSYAGGSFGPELKFAGYDALILTGASPRPVVVLVKDGRVELRPAEDSYWGMTTSVLEEAMRRDFDHGARVLSIGPAGERLLPWACLSTDHYHKAGRGGAGAVMGAKRVKAIAVRGTGSVYVGDAAAFLAESARLQHDDLYTDDNMWAFEEGTPILVDVIHGAGVLPTRNFSNGAFENVAAIDSHALLKKRIRNRACTQCGLACRQFHSFKSLSCEGPEFETIAVGGSNCGVGDLDAIAEFNAECDELGMDTISTGAVIALAMDLSERGFADLGTRFGDVDSYLRLPRMIVERDGVGGELALGARDLAVKYGHPELAAHVKNLEFPGYDPRGSFGMGLAYATSDRGACHLRAYVTGAEVLTGEMPANTLEGKAIAVVDAQNYTSIAWTGIWCSNWATTTSTLIKQFRHLWRREPEEAELLRTGERIWNLGRLLNLRQGLTAEDDTLPARILAEGHPDGAAAGQVIGESAFDNAVRQYYDLRGWDEHGVPKEATLSRLGVDVRL